MIRNVLNVFIASPSDMHEERSKATEVIDEVNGIIKEFEWSIELLRWEQTPPGYGRPQELINPDVEGCDLFIELLWQLWGTPPSKESRFSSGFEEEFFIAKTRREQAQSPEIWIFFKEPSASSIADPGMGLKQVLEFRKSLINEKQILFKDFRGTDSWEKMLRKFLLQHVLKKVPTHRATPEGSVSRAAKSLGLGPSEASDIDSAAAGAQLAIFARAIEPAFASGDLSLISASEESTFIAVRGMLLSAALVLASGTSASSLPTHELNTLYRFRDQLRATEPERKILFQAALGDDDSVNPGWYWFKNDRQAVNKLLLDTAFFHDQATAVATSFEILRRAGVSGAGSPYNSLWILAALEISENVRDSAWGYIVDVATQNDVEVLQEKAAGTWLGARVGWLRDWLASGHNLGVFLSKCPDLDLISKPLKLRIIRGISDIAIDSVQALTLSSDSELNEAASAEIKSRTFLRTEQRQHSRARRPLTLTSLLSGGLGSPSVDGKEHETDEERYERLCLEDNSSLNKRLNWYSLDGPPTYEILVERGEISRNTVGIDITEKFNRVHESSDAEKREQLGLEVAAAYRRKWDQFQDFIVEKFTLGALTALSNNPSVEDVEVARRFLRDRQCADAAIRIVALKGSSTDVSDLLEIAGSAYGERQELAIEGVLRLCSDRLGTVKVFLASKRRELNSAGLLLLTKLTGEEALPILQSLLLSKRAKLRIVAVGHMNTRLRHEHLETILWNYMQLERYYYDVVVWLDRLLYAPAPIREYYVSELEQAMKDALEE